MRDAELLVFHGYDDLAGRILPGVEDGLPKGRAAIHAAADGNGATVVLVELAAQATPPQGVSLLAARIDPKTRLVSARTQPAQPLYQIASSETVDSLAKALKPGPLPDPLREVPGAHVLVWCADGGVFSRVVRECLSLGCDRIRWTGIAARGMGAVVARIDDPPWYLLERWTRNGDDAAPVFAVDHQDRLYCRWGWTHPLAGRVRIAGNELLLADASGAIVRLSGAEWRDLYDAITLTADGLDSVRWSPAEPSPRFQVKLSLAETSEPAEAELWLLSKDDLPAVERLLGLMPESDLKHLAIAFFQPSPGGPAAALREVITGRGRGWVDFGGKGFRALSGLPGLFLPVDRALDPQVRRDRIAEAFKLARGEIVVVQEGPLAADGRRGMRALRLPEPSFKPLASYIDYVVAGDEARLTAVVASAVFDPGPLADLPAARPDATGALGSQDSQPLVVAEATAAYADGGDARDPSAALEPEPEPEPAPRAGTSAGAADAARRTHDLEVRIALDPPGTAADWLALARARFARGDLDAAVECLENARWIDPALDASAVDSSIAALEEARPGGDDDAVRSLRLRALYVESGRHPETTLTPAFLEQIYSDARAAVGSERLRKKTRWLVWRAVLSRTGDEIEAERQREQILADLNQDGLAPLDRTDFVRPRLAERVSGAGGDGAELQKSLEHFTARLAKVDDARLRWLGTSLLAMRCAELDDVTRATQLANAAATAARGPAPGLVARSPSAARILGIAAAALLRVGNLDGEKAFRDSLALIASFSNPGDRRGVLEAVLAALSSVGNRRLATPLARLAIPIIAEGDERHVAINLQRCGAALIDLGLAAEARPLALEVVKKPRVATDQHYLGSALRAVAILFAPGTLPEGERREIMALVERHQQSYTDVTGSFFESASAVGGEEYARRTSERMRARPPSEIKAGDLQQWTSAIEVLALARASDVGLEDLERALRLAWQLPADFERRPCVQALVSTIASFGRVGPGLALLREVITRCEPLTVGAWFKGEVLSACVKAIARLGDHRGAIDLIGRVIDIIDHTAREVPGDISFIFEVLRLCVDHAVALGTASEGAAIIKRVEKSVDAWKNEPSAVRQWTSIYRFKALATCARGMARLGDEKAAATILSRLLDAAKESEMKALDLMELLDVIVRCLAELGGEQRLHLVDRVLDALLSEKSFISGEPGPKLLALILDEVVSPASRVSAEYARFLGAEERAIRERVANEHVTGGSAGQPPPGPLTVARRV